MNKLREYFFILITIACVATIVYQTFQEKNTSSPKETSTEQKIMLSMEEKIFTLRANLAVGLADAIKDTLETYASTVPEEQIIQYISNAHDNSEKLALALVSEEPQHSVRSPAILHAIKRHQIALALYFRAYGIAQKILDSLPQDDTEQPLNSIIAKIVTANAADSTGTIQTTVPLTPEEKAILVNKMQWSGSLLVYVAEGYPKDNAEFQSTILTPAQNITKKIFIMVGLAALAFSCFMILLLGFSIAALCGKIKSHYVQGDMPSQFGIEVFAIYMVAMLLIPKGLELLSPSITPLTRMRFVLLYQVSTSLIILYPMIFGVKFSQITQTVGLTISSFGAFIKDVLLAPCYYCLSLGFMLIMLLVYSFFLQKLNIDVTSGTHPIIPVMLDSDNEDLKKLIVILAVICAPIIEEIMFRGVFYSWLRPKLGAFLTIITTSFIFAILHPQGMIGVVPLMFIGCVLAIAREWRGSLVVCMITHAFVNGVTMLLVTSLGDI